MFLVFSTLTIFTFKIKSWVSILRLLPLTFELLLVDVVFKTCDVIVDETLMFALLIFFILFNAKFESSVSIIFGELVELLKRYFSSPSSFS